MIETLQRGWGKNLNDIFKSVKNELTISSPYISNIGAEFLLKNVTEKFKENGVLKIVTDLSPRNIYQGSTDPNSFKLLSSSVNTVQIFHLPRLHAKIYISDINKAIITSGNLTAGGIYNNYEYGIFINDNVKVVSIKNDLLNYASLGAEINFEELNSYCKASEEIKKLYKQREKSTKKEFERNFQKAIVNTNDELLKARLLGGALHPIFEKTIIYLLQRNGALSTIKIHKLIKEIHPDLCEDSVDRIINGVRFGKKWKHAVRTAQQHLKKKNLVILENRLWKLV